MVATRRNRAPEVAIPGRFEATRSVLFARPNMVRRVRALAGLLKLMLGSRAYYYDSLPRKTALVLLRVLRGELQTRYRCRS